MPGLGWGDHRGRFLRNAPAVGQSARRRGDQLRQFILCRQGNRAGADGCFVGQLGGRRVRGAVRAGCDCGRRFGIAIRG